MPETQPSVEEENQKLRCENDSLRAEVGRLELELKKAAREARLSKSFLDKVTKTVEAKDALSSALSTANVKQRAYTEILLESCPNIIILFDNSGSFVLSTRILLTVMDMPNFDFIKNRSYEEVFPKYFSADSMKEFRAAVNKVNCYSDEIVNFDAWVDFSLNGKPRFYSVELRRTKAVEDSGVDVKPGILVVMVDLTDFMQEKQRAEAASNAKSDFLAAMSHEIRTPMNAIIGMSEMLDRSELNTKQKKYLSDIRQSSSSLLSIINDILDFSKIEAGKMHLAYDNYSLPSMLDHLHSMFKMLCKNKNLEFTTSFSLNIPKMIYGDENRIRQVLINILSNAVKYTNEGKITFSAWIDNKNNLHFSVTDTGIGIREEDKPKLFQPFEQFDSKKNKNVVGTGLGLPISYNLCKLMCGRLELESVYGEGSCFYVSIPYMPASDTSNENAGDVSGFSAPAAKILVVDDIDINLEVAEAMLGIFEITPTLAKSGLRAVELANTGRYDIIFMDHMMPEMDGLEATKHIRALGGWNREVPIIALTANAIDGMAKIFLDHGMADFLFKPLNLSSLNSCLKKWLPQEMIIKESTDND